MIQTFAWRLLRKSLPTRARAGKDSRCGIEENEVHCSLSAPFPGLLDLHTLGTSKLTHIFFFTFTTLISTFNYLIFQWFFHCLSNSGTHFHPYNHLLPPLYKTSACFHSKYLYIPLEYVESWE